VNRLLAIETSGEACSLALSLDGEILRRHELAPLRHAELLLPSVRALLEEAGVMLNSLDVIVFGRGPGSFTSLRIGIGAVQGLAWGADLPVVPISSLAAVAQQLLMPVREKGVLSAASDTEILVAVDARMSEVFHCSFRVNSEGKLEATSAEGVAPPADLTTDNPERTIGAGNGFERYPELEQLGHTLLAIKPHLHASAAALIPLALNWLKSNKPLPAIGAQPEYVRNQVAEKIG